MKNFRRPVRTGPGERISLALLLLALCFLIGVVLGHVLSRDAAAGADSELYRYLEDFFQVSEQTSSAATLLSALLLYFRYPVLAFLLGFASIGLVGLPLLSAAFGFFLSFSVCCFASAFGADGVLLALCVFGLRCVLTLPCYFLLAVPAFRNALSLAMLSFGDGKRVAPVHYGSAYFLRFAVCAALLLAGVFAELYLTPQLLRLVCGRIFG